MSVADPVWRFAGVAPTIGAAQSLAGSMWPMVVARESDHCWRQTDDERSGCVFALRNVRLRLCERGHYELCGCTDESSASRTIMTDSVGPYDKDLQRLGGVGRNNPTILSHCEHALRRVEKQRRKFLRLKL